MKSAAITKAASAFKGTPGTWDAPGLDGGDAVICVSVNGKRRTLAHVYGAPHFTDEQCDANAKLFAASKRLYEALETVSNFIADESIEHAVMQDGKTTLRQVVDAALTKAITP